MPAEQESEQIGGRVPPNVKRAIEKAVAKGYAITESDYVREAVVQKLREDKLL